MFPKRRDKIDLSDFTVTQVEIDATELLPGYSEKPVIAQSSFNKVPQTYGEDDELIHRVGDKSRNT